MTTDEGNKVLTIRSKNLVEPLLWRGGPNVATVNLVLGRYLWLFDRALRDVELTEGEALAICYAVRENKHLEPKLLTHLWLEVQEACATSLAMKFKVDADALVSKLLDLDPWHAWAVTEAAEIFWNMEGEEADRLRKIGFNITKKNGR